MACTFCFTGGSKDNYWDDVANLLWNNNTGCSFQTVNNDCIDNATRDAGCSLCTGCAYTGTNGTGTPSCYADVFCSTPCSVVSELPGAEVVTSNKVPLDAILIWSLTAALFIAVGLFWLKRRSKTKA